MTDRSILAARRPSTFTRRFSQAALALLFCLIVNATPQLLAQTAPKSHRKVVTMYDPEYPAIMKSGHFEGQVRLDVTVMPNGNVSKVDIRGGNPILAQCASQAVVRWKYAPAPEKTIEEVVFNFNPNH